jgi:hypothetical protein
MFPNALRALGKVTVASACTEKWSGMTGKGAVRFCNRCQLNVYDLSKLTTVQARALLGRFEGQRVCLRFFTRPDGTVMTRDCPLGSRNAVRREGVAFGATLAAALVVVIAAVITLFGDNIRRLLAQPTMGALAGDVDLVKTPTQRLPSASRRSRCPATRPDGKPWKGFCDFSQNNYSGD